LLHGAREYSVDKTRASRTPVLKLSTVLEVERVTTRFTVILTSLLEVLEAAIKLPSGISCHKVKRWLRKKILLRTFFHICRSVSFFSSENSLPNIH
jgi:hypothetical protein